jgi:hypothetical protein
MMSFVLLMQHECMLCCAAKSKGQRTKGFLRVLKYSHGGILEVTPI